MISNRISENSCDKNHFDKAAPDYNIALRNSGIQVSNSKATNYLVQSRL